MASVDALVMGRKTFESVRDMEARHCRARHCRARQAAMACNGLHASQHFPEVLGEINSRVPHRNLKVNSQQLSVIDIIGLKLASLLRLHVRRAQRRSFQPSTAGWAMALR